jgi:hypothetical protein
MAIRAQEAAVRAAHDALGRYLDSEGVKPVEENATPVTTPENAGITDQSCGPEGCISAPTDTKSSQRPQREWESTKPVNPCDVLCLPPTIATTSAGPDPIPGFTQTDEDKCGGPCVNDAGGGIYTIDIG